MSDQGETGERGPKGDHGQHGDTGQTGHVGEAGTTGDTGLTGETGERGPVGDLGPRGSTGPTGEVGERGREGKVPPQVFRAFIALGTVAFLALALQGCQIRQNHDLLHKLQNQQVSTKELQRESSASCQNYLELRNAVNQFHGTFIGLLKTAYKARLATYKRTHLPADLAAARAYRQLLRSLHTVSRTCAQRRGS